MIERAKAEGMAKPMPIDPPEGEIDRGVDADHLAGEVEHRAAGIAAVDRCVGLQEIVIGSGMDIARRGRDDPGSDRAAEAKRVADRQHPIADPGLGRIAPARRRQRRLGIDFQQRQIADLIAPDDVGLQARIIREGDGDLLGVGDHMVVGDDQSRRIDDEARAERGRRADPVRAARSAVVAEKVVEKLIERRSRRGRQTFGRVLGQSGDAGLGRRDVDHHAQQPRRQLREHFGKRRRVAAGRPGPAPPPAAEQPAMPPASHLDGRSISPNLFLHRSCRGAA